MSVIIRRIGGQTREFLNLVDEDNHKRAAVDVDGKYYGDASRITGILKPFDPVTGTTVNVIGTTSIVASNNANMIQSALDAAATDHEIDTIKLPNAKVFCDRLTLGFIRTGEFEIERVNHSGLTIEGGGKTFVVNKYHPAGFGVFFGEPYVIGYYDRIIDYQPGEPDVDEVTIQSGDPIVGGSQYAVGDFMYAFPQYFQQSIAHSRDCQLNKIVSITPGSGEITVTLEDPLPANLQATEATAEIKTGGVSAVIRGQTYGAAYETIFTPRVHFAGGGGSGTVARAIIGSGAVTAINVTNGGSGYTSQPTVTITPPTGETGTGATGVPVRQNGVIIRIDIDNAGGDYSVPPTVAISGGGGSGATAVTTIVPIGQIGNIIVTSPGSGYTSEPTVTIDPPPLFAKWVKNARKVSGIGDDYIVVAPNEEAEFFPLDSYVWLCTGPAYDDADGHYYRVRHRDAVEGRVYVTEAVRPQDYIAGQTLLLRGPFIENVTIRNVKCGGFDPLFASNWALWIHNTVNLTLENIQMLAGAQDQYDEDFVAGNIGTFRSQYIHLRNCLGPLESQTTHNMSAVDSLLNNYVNHGHCTDAVFSQCRISQYAGPHTALGSDTTRFAFRDCEFNFPTAKIVAPEGKEIVFDNCRVVYSSDDWTFDGPEIRFSNVTFEQAPNGALSFSDNCKYCVLEHLTTPDALTFASLSGGYYSNLSPEPTPPASWRATLRLMEITDPSTPPADTGVVYARDNGSGKSQVCARFHTGAVQVIASEP